MMQQVVGVVAKSAFCAFEEVVNFIAKTFLEQRRPREFDNEFIFAN